MTLRRLAPEGFCASNEPKYHRALVGGTSANPRSRGGYLGECRVIGWGLFPSDWGQG